MTQNANGGWPFGGVVRVRIVPGQIVVKRLPGKGTLMVEIMLEVTQGTCTGRRSPYSGWLNDPKNIAATQRDLRAMGWRGTKLGDWTGLGSREFEVTCMKDTRVVAGDDGKPTTRDFPRLTFPRAIRVINTEHAVSADELAALNESISFEAIAEAIDHDAANEAAEAASTGGEQSDIPF